MFFDSSSSGVAYVYSNTSKQLETLFYFDSNGDMHVVNANTAQTINIGDFSITIQGNSSYTKFTADKAVDVYYIANSISATMLTETVAANTTWQKAIGSYQGACVVKLH